MTAIFLTVIIIAFGIPVKVRPNLSFFVIIHHGSQYLYPEKSIDDKADSAISADQIVRGKARVSNLQEHIWEDQLSKSMKLHQSGKTDSALAIATRVAEACTKSGNRLFLIRALVNLATIRLENYKFEEAAKNLSHAEKIIKNDDPADLHFAIKNCQGLMYYHMDNYPVAIRYFQEIYDSLLHKVDHTRKISLYNNLGLVHLSMGEFSQAEALFKKAHHEAITTNSSSAGINTMFNLGKLYFERKQYAKAWDLIMESLQKFQEEEKKAKAEEASRLMGMIYMDQENYKLALNFFEQSLDLALELRHDQSVLENYRLIFTTYSLIRKKTTSLNYLLAELEYFKKWAYLKDSLYQDQTTDKILELEKQYETEKKNNQIYLLEKEKQIAEDKIKSGQIQRRYLIILFVLILVVLGFFVYSFSYYRRMTYLLQKQSRRIMNQQAQIKRQNEKLQKAVGTQNKLFSILAHDLRSPLISISNISKLINLYIRTRRYDDARELSRQMDRKNDHLLELTDNLLSWTKSQSEDFTPNLEKADLNKIVNDCLKIYEPVSLDKEITLSYEEVHDLFVLADVNMLQTILRNLINNAIKFTSRTGKVEIICKQEFKFAEITVRDNGIGISKENLEKIFELDISNTQSGTEGEKSTGLGLSICKEFTEAMGGTIRVESKENQGSSFIFRIPCLS